MARPAAKDLTDRELEIMHQFWKRDEATVADVRDGLAEIGIDLAQTTVGTLVRILHEKGFLEQTQAERPARYKPTRSASKPRWATLSGSRKAATRPNWHAEPRSRSCRRWTA